MRNFLFCVLYLATISIASFILGRLMPKAWFRFDRWPFHPFRFERDGQLYVAMGVRRWKDKCLDMSAIFPRLMASKKLPHEISGEKLELMVQETCIAEWIHMLLALLGFGCIFIWKNVGGWAIALLYALGNLPYVIIQRYNRPKLVRLMKKYQERALNGGQPQEILV